MIEFHGKLVHTFLAIYNGQIPLAYAVDALEFSTGEHKKDKKQFCKLCLYIRLFAFQGGKKRPRTLLHLFMTLSLLLMDFLLLVL